MRKSRILVIGNSNIEIKANIRRFPSGGENISGGGYSLSCSGCGINSAVAISKFGAEALCCSRVGDDIYARVIKRKLDNSSVDTRFISEEQASNTRLSFSAVDDWGRSSVIRFDGTCGDIDKSDLENAFISYPDAVLIQFDLPADVMVNATRLASEHEIPVFIDGGTVGDASSLSELENVEIFMLDEKEAYSYTGISPDAVDTCGKACMALAAKVNAKYIVLKLGERGAFFYDGMYFKFIPAYDVLKVDDSASGDAFTAAIAVEYMKSGDISRACDFACIAGAITVSKDGGTESIPTLDEMKQFVLDNEIDFDF